MHRLRHSPQQERSFAVRRVQPLLERGALVSCSDAGVPTIYPDETVIAGQRLAGAFDTVGSIDDTPVLLAGIGGT